MSLSSGGVLGLSLQGVVGDGDLVFGKLGGDFEPAARRLFAGKVFLVESGFVPPH